MADRRKVALKSAWLVPLMIAWGSLDTQAVLVNRDWVGPDAGAQDWAEPSNWSPSDVPNTTGSNGETGTVGGTLSADRVITIPASAFSGIIWNSDPGTFTDSLKLSGNVSLTPNPEPGFSLTNVGTAAQKVLDLNGHTLSIPSSPSGFAPGSGQLTIRSSVPGGILAARSLTRGVIESGVTARVSNALHSLAGVTFNDGSVYEASTTGRINGSPAGGVYDFNISGASVFTLETSPRVRNDMTISASASLGWRGNRTLRIGGDLTDLNEGAVDYVPFQAGSSGTIIFDGGAVTPRTVDVRRTGITTTGFRVGFDAATPGNAQLAHDLKTTSTFGVMANSVLDLQSFTVDGGVTTIGSATDPALLTFDFSDADTGRIAATNLTLNDFSLALEQAGPWTNGQDLILMTYSGAFSGAAELRGLTAPQAFSYDQLLTSDGSVRLTNVNIIVPEPAGIALFATGAGLLLFRRR